jgi:hypothetical protein
MLAPAAALLPSPVWAFSEMHSCLSLSRLALSLALRRLDGVGTSWAYSGWAHERIPCQRPCEAPCDGDPRILRKMLQDLESLDATLLIRPRIRSRRSKPKGFRPPRIGPTRARCPALFCRCCAKPQNRLPVAIWNGLGQERPAAAAPDDQAGRRGIAGPAAGDFAEATDAVRAYSPPSFPPATLRMCSTDEK